MHEINQLNMTNANRSNNSIETSANTQKLPLKFFFVGIALLLLLVLRVRIAPPDLAFYYSFAHSIVYNADFCFANEFQQFDFADHELYKTSLNLPANDWPMGTGVAWIPFLIVAWAVRFAASVLGLPSMANGFGHFDLWIVTYGSTILYSIGTLVLTFLYCQKHGLSNRSTKWAVILMAIGSSYSYHLFVNSADSHPPSAFFIILFLLLWQKNIDSPSLRTSFFAGCSIGMAGLIRPHNLIFLLVTLLDKRFLSPFTSSNRLYPRQLGMLGLGAVLAFFPQTIVWKTLYGSWIAIPRAEEVLWSKPELYNTLFSDFHGMISWSPLFGFGLLGLLTNKKWLPLALPVLIQLYIYSCNLAWWCGGSFGNRRMVCCAPLFILGLASLFDTIPKIWIKAVAAAGALWTLALLFTEVGGAIQLNHFQPWSEMLHGIQTGWWDGILKFLTGVNWSAFAVPRIVGFLSVVLFLGLAWIFSQTARAFWRRWLPAATAAFLVAFILLCFVAAQRTPIAAQTADLSAYNEWDRFPWQIYYEKAFYQIGRKDYSDACETLLATALADTRHPEPWMYLAYICQDVMGWKDQAYHFSYLALFHGKRTAPFLNFFDNLLTDRIQTITASQEIVYNQRGVIRGAQRRFALAKEDFRKSLAINPEYEPAKENLETLDLWEQGSPQPFRWRK